MAKTRSPGYPLIGLKEAVEKARLIYTNDYQNRIPRSVAASHMGYASLNGKSLGVLSALLKYGLLEGRGDETRLSDLAVTIIAHQPGTPERIAALQDAASRPELYSELDSRFQGGRASDQALRSYLLTQKFIPSAADAAIRAYRETKQLVSSESAGYVPDEAVEPPQETLMPEQVAASGKPGPLSPELAPGEAFKMSIVGNRIDVVGRLETPEQIDELVRRLKIGRLIITPITEANDTGPDESKPAN
jgi:hypothetical protein